MITFTQIIPEKVMQDLKTRFKNRRLTIGYTQKALSERSGVSLGSIKYFESTGKISLVSLLRISAILDCINDFENIANQGITPLETIKDILKENNPQRGRKK